MDITELNRLIRMLRANGVTRYSAGGLELNLEPLQPDDPDHTELPSPLETGRPHMSETLQAAMARLDPMYSDPSLFEIKQ